MSVKFIDTNRKKDYGDEILVRCNCGCGLASFRFYYVEDEDGEEIPCMSLIYYGSSDEDRKKDFYKANYMFFIEPQTITFLRELINGEIPENIGALRADNNPVLEIRKDLNPNSKEEDLMFLAYSNSKNFKKFAKSNGKKLKFLSWNLHLAKKEVKNFVLAMNKLFDKYFNEYFERKEHPSSNIGEDEERG